MDSIYCLIKIKYNQYIELRIYSPNDLSANKKTSSTRLIYKYSYPLCFTASNSKILFILLSYYNRLNVLSYSHLLYLGKEIYKAEVALQLGQVYIQE